MTQQKKEALIYIYEIMKDTDYDHPLTSNQVGDILENKYGIEMERRAISRNIQLLGRLGADIEKHEDNKKGSYMASHQFEDWELKVLVDAVQKAKFLNGDASKSLVNKLLETTSKFKRQNIKTITPKMSNDKGTNKNTQRYIQFIMSSMERGEKIQFVYGMVDVKGQLVPRNQGEYYSVSPYLLTWEEDIYYLIGYSDERSELRKYRLDRMDKIKYSSEKLISAQEALGDTWQMQLEKHLDQSVGHYGGENTVNVELLIKPFAYGYLYDEFGEGNVRFQDSEEQWVRVNVATSHNPGLYHKLLQYGQNIEVIGPQWVKDEYIQILNEILDRYR